MAKFYKLRVADVRTETADCVSVAFHVPDDLKSVFKYSAGQYVTLKTIINGEELRRSYSLCTSPVLADELRVAVKRVSGGRVSNYINEKLKAGHEVEVMPPLGNFHTLMHPANKKNYILFAGGSGITPMLSIIKTVLKVEPNSTIQLFYGNLNQAVTMLIVYRFIMFLTNPNRQLMICIQA
jgi:ring-1,2-phenylacetyl-CoA epoxidase subunit PaaE